MVGEPKLPKETCPAIDAIIKQCQRELDSIKYAIKREDDADELKYILDSVGDTLRDIISDIEDLRKANSDLREYGAYYKELFDEAVSELEAVEQAA